jgi:hypothetical protein
MLTGLGIGIGAELITWATVLIGGIFAVLAWIRVLIERVRHRRWDIPMALYAFAASVCLEPLWQVVNWGLPYDMRDDQVLGTRFPRLGCFCFLFIGFGLLLVSMAIMRKDSGPVKTIVKAGTVTLTIFYVLGFVFMIPG